MTPEETKKYIEHRLGELGWNIHIGKAAYEKIFRFTEGTADGTDQLCHKLLSLGALQDRREITDDVVSMAMSDLARMDDMLQRSSKAGRAAGEEADLASIDQLTAVLEAKVANGEVDTEIRLPERPGRSKPDAAFVRPQPAVQPKILIVDAAATTRAAFVKALATDYHVVQAADGEQAWKILLEQADIELIVLDLALPSLNGHELIKRARAAVSPPHLIGIPIIVVTGPEGADAKLRVLMAGANDFLLKNVEPSELRARVMARHRLSKTASRPPTATDRAPRAAAARTAEAKSKVRAAPAAKPPAAAVAKKPAAQSAELYTLTTEQRFPNVASRAAHHSLMKQIYRVSSTTTITLSATVLLALALAIIYVGRGDRADVAPPPPSTVARTDEAAMLPPPNVTPPADKPVTPNEPPNQESPAQAARPFPPVAPPVSGAGATTPAKDAESTRRATAEPVPSSPAVAEREPAPRPRIDTPSDTARAQPAPSAPPRASSPPAAPAPTDQVAAIPPPARPAPAPESPSRSEETATAERQTAIAPPSGTAPATATKISKEELGSFLRRFMSVYEAGDLDQFLTLFADNARTNDRTGRKGIREDYDALFRATDLRRMKLGEISWEVEGGQAYGWGDFEVNVRRANDQESYAYTGSMTFVLEKLDGRLRIVRLYHGQRRAEAR